MKRQLNEVHKSNHLCRQVDDFREQNGTGNVLEQVARPGGNACPVWPDLSKPWREKVASVDFEQ